MAMTNRVVVSGLSLFNDALGGEGCVACDFDLSWIFRYPSTLLWADEIIVSPTIHRLVKQGRTPQKAATSWDIITRIFFEVADKHKIVQVRDPQSIMSQGLYDAIGDQVNIDREALKRRFPDPTPVEGSEKTPGAFMLNGQHYCNPRIAELYFSLFAARIWDANVLLNPHAENYLRHYFQVRQATAPAADIVLKAFSEVMSQHLPELNILPPEAYAKCHECARMPECGTEGIKKAERALQKYSEWRDYDEIHQMKEVFDTIAREASNNPDPVDIVNKFVTVREEIQKRIRSVFPRIERWSQLTTIASIPVIVAGTTTGSAPVIGVGAGMAGIPKVIEKYLEYQKSKARWVGFKQTE